MLFNPFFIDGGRYEGLETGVIVFGGCVRDQGGLVDRVRGQGGTPVMGF